MAIKELIKTFAIFVGYKEVETNVTDPIQVASDYSGGLASNLGSASKSAKEIRKSLMGFDVLNVIQSSSDSSGGSDSGVGGGSIDPALLSALREYDSLMDNIKMKATDIRDNILEWFETPIGKAVGIGGAALLIAGIVSKLSKIGSVLGGLFGTKAVASGAASTGLFASMSSGFETLALSAMYAGDSIGAFVTGTAVLGPVLAGVGLAIPAVVTAAIVLNSKMEDLSVSSAVLGDKVINLGSNISKSTKKAVIPFLEKVQDLGNAITDLRFGEIVTNSDVENITAKTKDIADTLDKNIQKKYKDIVKLINNTDLFPDPKEREEYLKKIKASMEDEKSMVKFYQDEINRIIQEAANEHRNITEAEWWQIEEFQKQMGELGIKSMSKNQEEMLELTKNFNENFSKLKKSQVIDTIQKAAELREKLIKEATAEYDKRIELAQKAKDTIPGYTQEMYDQVVKKAAEARDKEVTEAEDAYYELYRKAEEAYPAITKTVDTETGKQLTFWQAYKKNVLGEFEDVRSKYNNDNRFFEQNPLRLSVKTVVDDTMSIGKSAGQNFSTGFKNALNLGTIRLTDVVNKSYIGNAMKFSAYANGGLPDIGEMFLAREAGPELVGRIGNKNAVVNNNQIVESVSRGVAQAVAGVMGSNGGNYNLYLDGKQLTDVIVERMNRQSNIAGVGVY